VAVRRPDGEIHTESHAILQRRPRLQRTLLRGPLSLVDAVRIGTRALRVAVRETTGADAEPRQVAMTLGAVGVGVLAVFVIGPGALVGGLPDRTADVIEAAARAGVLLVYLLGVSRSPQAQRLFHYHGAEHKAVAAYEKAGRAPSAAEAVAASPVHPRCGTNFIVLFVIAAAIVYSFAPRQPLFAGAAWRVSLVPVVVVLAYETMRASARGGAVGRLVTWPGRALQRITTREPSSDELEVAHAAMRTLLGDGP
jgi:uncharacterized protein YqhQ